MVAVDRLIWEAAKAVRPYLEELLGPEEGAELDAQLAQLLTSKEDPALLESQLISALEVHEPTNRFLVQLRKHGQDHAPVRIFESLGQFHVLPGVDPDVDTPEYHCPKGDVIWFRFEVGMPIPDCPTHHLRLVTSE